MMRNLICNIKEIKEMVKSKLSDRQIRLLRLSYDSITNPKDIRKHLNRLRYNQNVFRKSCIDFVPPVFVAVIADSCNLRCPSCLFLLKNPDKFARSFISPDKYCGVLERFNKKRVAEIIFLSGGEPLLHPQFDEIVDISKRFNASLKTSTNGILVKNKISSLLKLDYVNVSMDSYDYASHRRWRGGTTEQFDRIMEGLKLLKEKEIYFSMSYLLTGETSSGAGKFLELAGKIKPGLVSFHNVNPHGSAKFQPLTVQDKDTRILLDSILKRSDYPFDIHLPVIFDTDSEVFHNAKCVQPWYYFNFDPAGNIAYCCHLTHKRDIGNVFIGYDLNSRKMVEFREDVIKGVVPESCRFCQRRFMDREFGKFDSKTQKWFLWRNKKT